jgi:hypothetical protein
MMKGACHHSEKRAVSQTQCIARAADTHHNDVHDTFMSVITHAHTHTHELLTVSVAQVTM